ncbi:hypothetical protein Tco_0436378, partial [Tanacetum coccineum]
AQAFKSLDSRYHRLVPPRLFSKLEFASKYYIPKNLHPELPGPGDHIVDFPEGKNNRFLWVDEKVFPTVVAWRTATTKDDKPKANTYSVVDVATLDTHQMDLFNLIKAPNPTKVKTGTRQRTAHEVPLLTAIASRVIQMVDATELSTSSGTPFTVERSPLDFSNEDAPPPEKTRKRDTGEEGPKAPAKVLRKDHNVARAEHSARGGKSLAGISVDTGLAIHAQKTQEPPIATQTVNDPNPLSYAKPQTQQDVTQLTISPNVEVSFFKLLRTTDDVEDMTFDVYVLPCYGLVLFVTALFIHAL